MRKVPSISGYDGVILRGLNLACTDRGILKARYPLWYTV